MEFFLKINKRAGRNIFQKSIKGQTLIRGSMVEFFSEVNKRAYPFIRHIRVIEIKEYLLTICTALFHLYNHDRRRRKNHEVPLNTRKTKMNFDLFIVFQVFSLFKCSSFAYLGNSLYSTDSTKN